MLSLPAAPPPLGRRLRGRNVRGTPCVAGGLTARPTPAAVFLCLGQGGANFLCPAALTSRGPAALFAMSEISVRLTVGLSGRRAAADAVYDAACSSCLCFGRPAADASCAVGNGEARTSFCCAAFDAAALLGDGYGLASFLGYLVAPCLPCPEACVEDPDLGGPLLALALRAATDLRAWGWACCRRPLDSVDAPSWETGLAACGRASCS